MAVALGAWAAVRHLAWARADHALPIGDAPGHVMIAMRWWFWFTGQDDMAPNEPFPPAVYLSLVQARLHQGDSFDDLQVAMAGWSALLVGGAAWAAARGGGGLPGALLAGLLVLRAPHATLVARQFLLDGPATAMLLLTLGAAWWARGFRRPLPALVAGLLGGGLVVTKYSLLPWLLGPVLLWAAGLILRRPAALLPIGLTGLHLAWWGQQLWARREQHGLRAAVPWEVLQPVALVVGALLIGTLLMPALWPDRGRRTAWREGLRRGLAVALACHGALLVALTWLWWGFPSMWGKVQREALVEVRSAGWEQGARFALVHLVDGVPLAGWATLVALAGIGLAAAGRDRARASLAAGALTQALAALALGTWLISRSLPLDTKYYAPVAPLVAVGLAAALGAHRGTRWIVAPLASLALLIQLHLVGGLPTRTASQNPSDAAAGLLWRLPATWTESPAPMEADWEAAAVQVVREGFAVWPETRPAGCGGYVIEVPTGPGVEDRAFMAQGTLWGHKDEHWARPRSKLPLCGGIRVVGDPNAAPPEGGRVLSVAQVTSRTWVQSWVRAGP